MVGVKGKQDMRRMGGRAIRVNHEATLLCPVAETLPVNQFLTFKLYFF